MNKLIGLLPLRVDSVAGASAHCIVAHADAAAVVGASAVASGRASYPWAHLGHSDMGGN